MPRAIESHEIPGPAGRLEAMLEEPEGGAPHFAALVCHPHPLFGGTMLNKVVYRLARGARHAGGVVLRFNFRGVGRSEGEHGNLTGEIEDARASLAWLRARYPALPYMLSGFSFGSRVITRLGCEIQSPRLLLAAGFPTKFGPAEYLSGCSVPKVFIQSTNDEHAPRHDFEEMFPAMGDPKQVHWIEAADHFFAGSLQALEQQVTASVAAIF